MAKILAGDREFFKGINQLKYEGPESANPIVDYRYDENNVVAGKSLKNHVRVALAYEASLSEIDTDPFGEPTQAFADNTMQEPDYRKIKRKRHASFNSGKEKAFTEEKLSLPGLMDYTVENGQPASLSGVGEHPKNRITRCT